MTKEEALEKIKKLLRTNGRTEAEADTASVLASCITQKHGIDLETVDLSSKTSSNEITHLVVETYRKWKAEYSFAGLICKRFFEVHIVHVSIPSLSGRDHLMVFIGKPQHIEIATYVYHYLVRIFALAWNNRSNKRLKKRKDFIVGAYLSLSHKLTIPTHVDQQQLILNRFHQREEYLKSTFNGAGERNVLTNIKSRSGCAGWVAGKDINIRPAVEGAETTTKLIAA